MLLWVLFLTSLSFFHNYPKCFENQTEVIPVVKLLHILQVQFGLYLHNHLYIVFIRGFCFFQIASIKNSWLSTIKQNPLAIISNKRIINYLQSSTTAPYESPTPKPARTTFPCSLSSFIASHRAMGIVEDTVLPTVSI